MHIWIAPGILTEACLVAICKSKVDQVTTVLVESITLFVCSGYIRDKFLQYYQHGKKTCGLSFDGPPFYPDLLPTNRPCQAPLN